jgi:hypothetical protein
MTTPLGIATGNEAQDKAQVEHLDGGRLEDQDEKAAITGFQSSFESKYAGERGDPCAPSGTSPLTVLSFSPQPQTDNQDFLEVYNLLHDRQLGGAE